MKILFFSDVHGSPEAMKILLARVKEFAPETTVLLGDALYHGPRNPLPAGYAPPEAVKLLNRLKNSIVAVRGNCDAEVDQLLLEFPIMADYSTILTPRARFFLTHGHLWTADAPPPLPENTVFAGGHTHIPRLEKLDNGLIAFNPGSIALPKGGNPPSYGTFDGRELTVRELATGKPMLMLTL
ncbi:MAG: phosphodiesterase [Victivallaceae bacterium]|nr:phosphodiesterase [Victivallaceae bacterium]